MSKTFLIQFSKYAIIYVSFYKDKKLLLKGQKSEKKNQKNNEEKEKISSENKL